jgi:hypothetical protein
MHQRIAVTDTVTPLTRALIPLLQKSSSDNRINLDNRLCASAVSGAAPTATSMTAKRLANRRCAHDFMLARPGKKSKMDINDMRYKFQIAIVASLAAAVLLSSAYAAPAADDEAQAQEAWRDSIVRTDVPDDGCFYAAYPSTDWLKVPCTEAANVPATPRVRAITNTVGDGTDYFAEGSGLISRTVGSFPKVTVTGETGTLGANDYDLQLNSNFMNTAPCKGHPGCSTWVQFLYSNSYGEIFFDYWLLNYGATCPSGWTTDPPSDCDQETPALFIPQEAITSLATLKLSGKATAKGRDTLIFTAGTQAYSVTGKDDLVDLATAWQYSEFGVYGDGYGSAAMFNPGTLIWVKIGIVDGSTTAPTCVSAGGGGTSESNNLNLGKCHAYSATIPYITFKESN